MYGIRQLHCSHLLNKRMNFILSIFYYKVTVGIEIPFISIIILLILSTIITRQLVKLNSPTYFYVSLSACD